MKKMMGIAIFLVLMPTMVFAEVKTELIKYKQGDTDLDGYLVYDDAIKEKRPGVLVVHDWMGFADYSNNRAKMLAELGYVALAVDIYGQSVRPKNTDEASQQATKYKTDRALMRARIQAGLDELKKNPLVDTTRTELSTKADARR